MEISRSHSSGSFSLYSRLTAALALIGLLVVGGVGAMLRPGTAVAATGINQTINFQGRLLDDTGAVVPDGTYNMQFKIYQDGDGVLGGGDESLKWTETRVYGTGSPDRRVTVRNGYFNVQLGGVTAFGGSVDWNQDTLWLSLEVGDTGTAANWGAANGDGEMSPFRRLTATPYALNAGRLGGLTASGFIQNTTTPQTANISITSAGAGDVGAQIQGAASGTAAILVAKGGSGNTGDLLQLQSSAATLARFDASGNLFVASSLDRQTNGTLSLGTTSTATAISLGRSGITTTNAGALTVSEALTANGTATFNTDANLIFAGAENLSVTSDLATAAVDVFSLVVTPSGTSSTGTGKRGLLVQQANSANGNGLASALAIDNADTDLAVTDAIIVTSSGGGFTNYLNTPTIDITGTGAITGATGITSTGTVQGGTLNATTAYQANGTPGVNVSCSAGQANLGGAWSMGLLTTAGTCTAVQVAGNYLIQAPSSTATNTITPTGSTTGLTVNGSSTATLAVAINQSQAADAVNVNVTGGSQTNGILVNRTNAGTLTNAINITNTSGTVTNGLLFGGTIGTDINRTSGTLTLQGAGGVSITAGGTNTAAIDTGGAGTITLGGTNATTVNVGTRGNSKTVQIGAITGSGTDTIGIGNNATSGSVSDITLGNLHGASTTTIQAGTGNLKLLTNSASATILAQSQTNSTAAFQVLNASSGQLLSVDSLYSNMDLLGVASGGLGSAWTTHSNLFSTAVTSHSTVTANGYLYVLGGRTTAPGTTPVTTVSYTKINADGSIPSGTWSTTTALPDSGRYTHSSVVANGYIYVIGGRSTSGTEKNTVYYAKINADGTLGTWNTTTAFPGTIIEGAAVFVNGYIYVVGGFYNSFHTAGVRYAKVNPDGSLGSWSLASNGLPSGLRTEGRAAVANGIIYFTGGNSNPAREEEVSYVRPDPATGDITTAWTTSAPSLPAAIDQHALVVSNGYLYAIGGRSPFASNDTSQTTIYRSRLGTNGAPGAWATAGTGAGADMPALPVGGRAAHTAVVVNGHIYVIGGHSGNSGGYTVQNSLYRISTSRVRIGASLDLVGLQNTGALSDDGAQGGSGSTGGSITAGQGMFVGGLEVQGQTSLNGTLSVLGTASFGNGLSVRVTSNSIVAFDVKDASGNSVLTVDTVNNKTIITSNIQWGATAAVSVTTGTGCATSTTTSTTFVEGSSTCGIAFVAPPSGKVMVSWATSTVHNQTDGYCFAAGGVRDGSTVGSGTVVAAASDHESGSNRSEVGGKDDGNAGASRLVTGLTSGANYNATIWHKVIVAGTCTFARRSIFVVPVL